MKRFIENHKDELIAGAIVVILFSVLLVLYMQHMATALPKSYRTQIMQVITIDNDNNATLEDYEGNLFIVNGDYTVGDCYSVLFDTNNTEDITDDVIVKITYGGKWYTPLQMEEAVENSYEMGYQVCLNDDFYDAKG